MCARGLYVALFEQIEAVGPVLHRPVTRLHVVGVVVGQTHLVGVGVRKLCAVTSVRHAARWHAIDWKTAKALDFRALEQRPGPVDLDGVRRLAMDEFAIHKGHRYATVVVDVERKRVRWVGRGRSRAEIRPFFERLGPERCAQIQAVAMDMNTAYDLEVRQH